MVARSLESPVVKAIASLAREIAEANISVRMIMAHADHDTFGDAWSDAGHVVGFDHEVRWARHPRLIEAHEQLVLGPQTCWIGDSMRRDPTKCDAFESYVEGCGEAAGCALVSFERLWIASEPLLARGRRSTAAVIAETSRYTSRGAGQARRRVGDDRRHAALILFLRFDLISAGACAGRFALAGRRLGKKRKMSASPRNGGEQGEFRHCSVTGR